MEKMYWYICGKINNRIIFLLLFLLRDQQQRKKNIHQFNNSYFSHLSNKVITIRLKIIINKQSIL